MFNIGGAELLVIALVALVVVGPEQLPGVLRKAGKYAAQARTMSNGLRQEFMAGVNELDPNNWDDSTKASDEPKGTAANPIVPRGYAERVKAGDAGNPFKPVSKKMAEPTPEEAAAEAEAEALKAQRRAEAARERAEALRAEAADRAAADAAAENAAADNPAAENAAVDDATGDETATPPEAATTSPEAATTSPEAATTPANGSGARADGASTSSDTVEPVVKRNSIADANSSKALES